MTGICKLCLAAAVELQKSHLIPAGVFRRLRDTRMKNSDPAIATRTGVYQSSKQDWAWLLCKSCEQRLAKNGESWVLHHSLDSNGNFPLDSILALRTPESGVIGRGVYHACNIPEIDISALVYFGVSMFWRSSVYGWGTDGSFLVRLGPFQEKLRAYLMGIADFPTNCCMWVLVRQGKQETRHLTAFPTSERHGNVHVHKFHMPGLVFTLIASNNLRPDDRRMCIMRGRGNPIVVGDFVEIPIKAFADRLRAIGIEAQGRKQLAKMFGPSRPPRNAK